MAQASEEKLEHTGSAEKERVALVPQREQLATNAKAMFAKWKRNRALCPEHQIVRWERVNVSESSKLARERKEFQEKKRGQAKRSSLGEVEESTSGRVDAKALQNYLDSFGFTPSLSKLEIGKMEKEVGRR